LGSCTPSNGGDSALWRIPLFSACFPDVFPIFDYADWCKRQNTKYMVVGLNAWHIFAASLESCYAVGVIKLSRECCTAVHKRELTKYFSSQTACFRATRYTFNPNGVGYFFHTYTCTFNMEGAYVHTLCILSTFISY
jgi:hypothetical protein